MTLNWQHWCWQSGLAIALASSGAIASSVDCALAQITPDATLGAESSVVTPQAPGSVVDVIKGGATRGANLFHSFEQFSVLTGRTAYFNNSLQIQNIISRVTGGSVSNIDGLLKANGTANLFLINPNGIIFGSNASLNIGGSFLASTASSLNFADGRQFSAKATQTRPLLTISVPIGVQFGGTAGSILNQSQATNSRGEIVGLQVQPGKTLALVGGDVSLDGGNLQAPGGRVELGGVAGAGTVGLNVNSNNLGLSFPAGVQRADVSLTNGASVDVTAGGGGSIAVNARNLDISGESGLVAGIRAGLGSIGTQAGNIEIDATDKVTIEGPSSTGSRSTIRNRVDNGALGSAGNIVINTGSLDVSGDAAITTTTSGQGNAGGVSIQARDTVSLSGTSRAGVFSAVGQSGVGNAAGINIKARSLSLSDGAELVAITAGQGNGGNIQVNATESISVNGGSQLQASTGGQGNAGNVTIQAGGTVSLDGVNADGVPSQVSSSVGDVGNGKGGNINIQARSLSLTNGALLASSTLGQGDAGSVNINARDTVSFDGVGSNGLPSAALSNVEFTAVGNGGNINITTGSLSLANGASLVANTRGQGAAGKITVTAIDAITFDGVGSNGVDSNRHSSGAFSTVEPGAVGKGGEVNVTTGSLSLTNGALLAASTVGQGDAGSVTIHAGSTVSFDGVGSNGVASGALSTVDAGAVGQGGSVNVTTGSLSVTNGAGITVDSQGKGNAGNLLVQAGSVTLDRDAFLFAKTASGEGGNIRLRSQDLLLMRHGSQISATAGTAQAGGDGGNITINTPFIVAIPSENSDITANAYTGKGGFIQITAQGVFGIERREQLTPLSNITAFSQKAPNLNGVIQINTLGIDPSSGLVALPAEPVDVTGLIAQGCPAGGGAVSRGASEFIVTGRGGLPPQPGEALRTSAVAVNAGTLKPGVENRSAEVTSTPVTRSTPAQLVEAQGWVINAQGQVVLTASAVPVLPNSSWSTPTTCHAP